MKKAVLFAVLAFLMTGRMLLAQSTTEGAIGGLVVDQSKGVLPGVTVNAKNVANNSMATTTTDASGHFTVIRLNPGTYAVPRSRCRIRAVHAHMWSSKSDASRTSMSRWASPARLNR